MEEFGAAREAVLQAERNLAAAKGEEYAVPVEFPVCWDTGAPLPYLLHNDYRTFLAFFLRDVDPNWDGTYVKVRNTNSGLSEKLALVEFERCICAKMGDPNDEVLRGHPLYGKGLAGYKARVVENSTWLKARLRRSMLYTTLTIGNFGAVLDTTSCLFTIQRSSASHGDSKSRYSRYHCRNCFPTSANA